MYPEPCEAALSLTRFLYPELCTGLSDDHVLFIQLACKIDAKMKEISAQRQATSANSAVKD